MAEEAAADPPPVTGLMSINIVARLLMITGERIRQLTSEGYIPQSPERGMVSLPGAVQGYIRFLKDEQRGAQRNQAENDVRVARAQEIRMRTAERARTLCDTEEACECVDKVVSIVLSELDGLPVAFTRDLSVRRKLQKMIDDIRHRVSTRLDEIVIALRTGQQEPVSEAEADA